MGEMIKFGIKLALTIACATALIAALLILFNLISSLTFTATSAMAINEIFRIFSIIFPIDLYALFVLFGSLGAFKVAYWAADKMIQFISATS